MNPLPDVAGDLAELMENQGLFSKSVERKCATYKSHVSFAFEASNITFVRTFRYLHQFCICMSS